MCNAYQRWWDLYIITDVEGRKTAQRQNLPSPFDFGLMVETVSPKQQNRGDTQEETERLPVQEGLRKYAENHVLLVGKPGSGKSTALARLLLEEAEKTKSLGGSGCIPVLVELRQYKTSMLELIEDFLGRHELYLDVEIKTLLRKGQFLLLVDGLNELPNEEARRELKTFRQNNPKTPMIFTTRDLGFGGDLGIEKKLEMQPLKEEQMQQFIRAYLPEKGEEMLRRLGGRLREFGQTPLLLWMLCDLFKQSGNLPPNLGLVFRCFTQSYVGNVKDDVPVSGESRRWWEELLKHLAFTMMQGETPKELRVVIDRQEAEEILTKFLECKVDYPSSRAKEWLEDLLKHHLIQVTSNKKIEFRHQMLQEYYAAEYLWQLLPSLNDDNLLKQHYLNYLKWTEPLALMLALVDNEKQALRIVKLALDVDLQLGARLAGSVKPNFQVKTVTLIIELNVPQLLKNKLLGITRSEVAIDALRKAWNDKDSDVSSSATFALGQIGSEAAISELLKALENPNVNVYRRAAEWLAYLDCQAAIPGLRKKLADLNSSISNSCSDKDVLLWMSIVRTLGKLSRQEAISELHEKVLVLDEPFNMFVMLGAARLLGQLDGEGVLPQLLKALKDPKSHIRKNAAIILGQMGEKTAIPGLLKTSSQDLDAMVRLSATEALVNLDSKVAIPILLKKLVEPDNYIREQAAKILIKLNSPVTYPNLLELLNHPDENISWVATIVLGQLGKEEALPKLLKELKNEIFGVRRTAALMLEPICSQKHIPELLQTLEDQYYCVRRSAAIALGYLGREEAIPQLVKALRHYYPSDNCADIQAVRNLNGETVTFLGISNEELETLGSEDAIELWLCELDNLNIYIRVAEALGKISTKEAIEGLLGALQYSRYHTRWAAAIALGQLGRKEGSSELLEALGHHDPDFRKKVVEALSKLDNEETIQKLLNCLETQDSFVCKGAAEVLEKISSPTALSSLWDMRLTGREDFAEIIEVIQTHCKLYNYRIAQSSSKVEETKTKSETMKYKDFQILVDNNNKIRASSEQGDVSGEFRLEMNEINLALKLIKLQQADNELLKALGSKLYQALFPNQINARFHATMAGAQANEYSVRLRLLFQSPQLAALPWEFLYNEETNAFLGNNTQTMLSRYIDVPLQKRDIIAANLPLKVLLVISSPTDLAKLDATGEETLIRAALKKHIEAAKIELDVIQEATVRNINQKLREKPYNIFHFIGHGVFENNKGYMALEDTNKAAKLLDDEGFANFFLGNRSLGLVVLNSCQGAEVSGHQIFAGIAPNLVQRGIPAVVAMQYPILDSTAKLFADEFYRTLALGYPVDAAIQTTRNAISQEVGLDKRDFATPVLYMRAKDGIILNSYTI
ncbi:HEAT repeat domain-containing protein [Scytonema sp. UIC 10036]|uniref:HEAT repeat domain-containing protein n=1 Tax=Scytonema sp. UIC 10036 TaxID=2304196 RepID=UPI001A9B9922